MAVVRHKRGATALLFDRLITREQAGDGAGPKKVAHREVYDLAELRASIEEQLGWLLNTRVPLDYQLMEVRMRQGVRTTVDYGLPDLTVYPIGDSGAMVRLAEHLAQTIGVYEPRLRNPRVRILATAERGDLLTVEVAGEIRIGMVSEPVVFALPLHLESAGDGH
jgi:type VI secretion system lysozyme-like protein